MLNVGRHSGTAWKQSGAPRLWPTAPLRPLGEKAKWMLGAIFQGEGDSVGFHFSSIKFWRGRAFRQHKHSNKQTRQQNRYGIRKWMLFQQISCGLNFAIYKDLQIGRPTSEPLLMFLVLLKLSTIRRSFPSKDRTIKLFIHKFQPKKLFVCENGITNAVANLHTVHRWEVMN